MDLLGFIRQNKFNADVRDTIKFMKWNNSLKRKLDAKTDVISITTEELVEFMESVYQMIVKRSSRLGTINQQHQQPPLFASVSPVDAPPPLPTPPPVIVNNDVKVSNCVGDDKDTPADYDIKVVNTD